MGLGVAIAGGSVVVALIVLVDIGTTIPAAIRAEEAHLRDKFGDESDIRTCSADQRHGVAVSA